MVKCITYCGRGDCVVKNIVFEGCFTKKRSEKSDKTRRDKVLNRAIKNSSTFLWLFWRILIDSLALERNRIPYQ